MQKKNADNSASAYLPTEFGDFEIKVWPESRGLEPIALITKNFDPEKTALVRVHSECITGDTFHSCKCDCGTQKDMALKMINESKNGIFIYLRQEGRDIGIYEKVKAYGLQDQGFDTYQANVLLGHKPDQREYSWAKTILDELKVKNIRILTNNPSKVFELTRLGIKVIERIPLLIESNKHNKYYLDTKRIKFGHLLTNETKRHYISISGIKHTEEVEYIADLKNKIQKNYHMDPLMKKEFKTNLGIYCDSKSLTKIDYINDIKKIFQTAKRFRNLVPVLHYSFRYSKEPIKEINQIKAVFPFVKYVQLNDLKKDWLKETFDFALKKFSIILPLSKESLNLIEDPNLVKKIIKNKTYVLLDNSGATGPREKEKDFIINIDYLLEKEINNIALAGGFGPDYLSSYFKLTGFFKMFFSIDAESGLKIKDKLDQRKIASYLEKLMLSECIQND